MKQTLMFSLLVILALLLAACSGIPTSSVAPETIVLADNLAFISTSPNTEESLENETISYIKLNGNTIAFEGSGATVSGSTITITSAGAYSVSGTLNSGQIVVDAEDEDKVTLILNGASITSSSRAPIFVRNAEKVILTLAEDSQNFVTDGSPALFEDVESEDLNAAIFSKDDLTINGSGTLTVNANYHNGIISKDDLRINGGVITVNAVNDGLKGRNFISVKDGTITVNAGGDGLQSNNDEDAERGYVVIEGGTLDITAAKDGIQAVTDITINGGTLNITTGGGSANSSDKSGWGIWGFAGKTDTNDSAKGMKAGQEIVISGGSIRIDSSDDAIHSNNNLTVNGGDIFIASGDDGMHADSTLTINSGVIQIAQSYEGIESAVITINDGRIHVVASDDGLNTAGGSDGSSLGGRPGQNVFAATGNYRLHITGGYLYVEADGDGLDSNGPIDMTGGVVIINGPTANNNGALDYDGSFNITGGTLLTVGSAGMSQAPSESSGQVSFRYNFETVQAAGTLVHIQSADGKEILTFSPVKSYQSLVFSSPELAKGATYLVSLGGSSSGTPENGLYIGGQHSGGSQTASFTLSGVVTYAGSAAGGSGPGRGGGPSGGGPRP